MAKVLALVSYKVYPAQMGGQKGIACFYEHLKKLIPVTEIVSIDNIVAGDANRIKLLYPNRQLFQNIRLMGKLKSLVRQQQIDMVIAEHSYPAWVALLLRWQTKVPFIIHSHNIEARRFAQMGKWWWQLYFMYEKWIHQKADHNFFISEEDQQFAVHRFQLKPQQCTVITYGIETPSLQNFDRKKILSGLGIWENEKVLFFNGTLNYKPNYDAVLVIVQHIIPLLQKKLSGFKVIISGNRIPQDLQNILAQQPACIYLDYVPDVDVYYQIADVFINPIINNSGVKTKVIEAMGNGCTVVSTTSGAAGINKSVCGKKLRITPDGRWQQFVDAIINCINKQKTTTSKEFFAYYLWDNIAQQTAASINKVVTQHGSKAS